jgi:hypothetical protein
VISIPEIGDEAFQVKATSDSKFQYGNDSKIIHWFAGDLTKKSMELRNDAMAAHGRNDG